MRKRDLATPPCSDARRNQRIDDVVGDGIVLGGRAAERIARAELVGERQPGESRRTESPSRSASCANKTAAVT
jgi:hypothetical protein